MPSIWSYSTSTTRSGRSGTHELSMRAFHRFFSPGETMSAPTRYSCSSSSSSLRRATVNADAAPTMRSPWPAGPQIEDGQPSSSPEGS